jgi:hypothetical protein
VSKKNWLTQTVFSECFSQGLQEEFKGCCEKGKVSAKCFVVDNAQNVAGLSKNILLLLLCPNTALHLPSMEDEIIATSEACYM